MHAALEVPISGWLNARSAGQRGNVATPVISAHTQKKSEKRVAVDVIMGCRLDRRVHLSAAPMGVFRWPPPPVKCATERAGSHRGSIHYARGHRNRRVVRVTEGRRRIIKYI
jgi:hypothetical protein